MNVFVKNDYLRISFSNGETYEGKLHPESTNETMQFIMDNLTDEEAIYNKFMKTATNSSAITTEDLQKSKILVVRGASVYMPEVSEISLPADFVKMILIAEANNDKETLVKFKNFWTLVSLNPDARVRNNLFWFIRKWGIEITPTGLLVAYRNAMYKHGRYTPEQVKNILKTYYLAKYVEKADLHDYIYMGEHCDLQKLFEDVTSEDKGSVFTDAHSRTTTIKLGHPVSIPREECDSNQEHSCSAGLHVGAPGWLTKNYYGDVGLQVLVNPAKVIAVPTIDQYGKMRVCEYFPIALIDFDEEGNVVAPDYNLYNDLTYLQSEDYLGEINNEDFDNYKWNPDIIETNEDIYNNILARVNELQ